MSPHERQQVLENLSEKEAEVLRHDWQFWARDEQLPPPGNWRIWLFMGGRGSGKTRAGAEWVLEVMRKGRMRRVALVGATYADARSVMVQGDSGLLSMSHDVRLKFEPSKREVHWPNGALAQIFTAEEPDGLRGFQFDGAWCDEFAKWRDPQAALDMLMMGLRLGDDPRCVVTTTPRAVPAFIDLMTVPGVAVTRARTIDNAPNLASAFLAHMQAQYAGTRLGRQELDAELIEDNDAALWRRDWIDRARVREVPPCARVVVAVDPPVSAGAGADECGIVVVGRSEEGEGYVQADRSEGGLTPISWATRVARAYAEFKADTIVAEANQGGAMVEAVIRQVVPFASVHLVHATRGKHARAVPAAALYERGLIHHAGVFPELEDQLCQFDGSDDAGSPDRLDALVWALADLFPPNAPSTPKVRGV